MNANVPQKMKVNASARIIRANGEIEDVILPEETRDLPLSFEFPDGVVAIAGLDCEGRLPVYDLDEMQRIHERAARRCNPVR